MKIILSHDAPIAIKPEEWHVIADTTETFQDESSLYLAVRAHADGRAIVYGYDGEPDRLGGPRAEAGYVVARRAYLDRDMPGIVAAIKKVAFEIGSETIGRECVRKLPAEDL